MTLSSPSYFQVLPLDVLIKIVLEVRHPAGAQVDELATARQILVLLKGPHSLREAARSVFDGVSTIPNAGNYSDSCIRVQQAHILADILRYLGDSTRTVSLQCRRGDGEWLIDTLKHHARHVSHLALHGVLARCFLDQVLAVVPQLQSLSVHCRYGLNGRHLHSLLKYASGITSLELHGLSGSYSFANFWPNFNNLTHLALTVDTNNGNANDDLENQSQVFDGIHTACRQLRTLSVRKLDANGLRNVARLCASLSGYGILQKVSLDFKHIPENTVYEQLEIIKNALGDTTRVAVSCTSAQFLPALSVLGSSLVEIRPKTVFNRVPAGLRQCASNCTRIEKVLLQLNDCCTAEFIGEFLSGRVGAALKQINVTTFPSHTGPAHHHPATALEIIAEKTGNLEHFEYNPLESAEYLVQIARRNPCLKSVRISPIRHGETPQKWILDAVSTLAKTCHHLEEIHIMLFADFKAGQPGSRITGLDKLLASMKPMSTRRCLRVRVGDDLY